MSPVFFLLWSPIGFLVFWGGLAGLKVPGALAFMGSAAVWVSGNLMLRDICAPPIFWGSLVAFVCLPITCWIWRLVRRQMQKFNSLIKVQYREFYSDSGFYDGNVKLPTMREFLIMRMWHLLHYILRILGLVALAVFLIWMVYCVLDDVGYSGGDQRERYFDYDPRIP